MTFDPPQLVHILSTACALVFLLVLFIRFQTTRLWGIRYGQTWWGRLKAALSVLLSLILFSFWAKYSVLGSRSRGTISVSLLASIVAALGPSLSLLPYQKQQYSHRASNLATLYLITSVLCDVVYLAIPRKSATLDRLSSAIFFRCFMHSVLLSLEGILWNLEQGFFTWINPIIVKGYRGILVNDDLPPLNRDMKAEFTREVMLQTWSERFKPETRTTLPLALIKCLKIPFLAAIVPRIFLIAARYSQPVLIKRSIKFVAAPPLETNTNHGFWLIVSALTIYTSLAMSTAAYQHCLNRLKLMTKSALIGLIHDKSMRSPSIAHDDGEATTLISIDADSLGGIGSMVHETWAHILEVLVGLSLLAGQVGWIWPIPLLIIYSNALGVFSPAITLISFAILSMVHGNKLDTETAFTTMAILSMVTHPANMVMTIMPRAVAAYSGFERMQAFLTRESPRPNRGTLPKDRPNVSSLDSRSGQPIGIKFAVQIRHMGLGHKQPVLDDLNIDVVAGSFTIISGPTGSGKSTLLRAILGEVVPVRGSINTSTRRIAYCAQKPWLPNGTIREAIHGLTKQEDSEWYDEVTNMCCLKHDFQSFPYGDRTQIGSRGLNLSGGQRLRVTFARAIFARCEVLLLDDIFSGLDGETEQTIFQHLFRSTGLVRRLNITVILVSNFAQYFDAADHIVVLGNQGIVDQGDWHSIKVKPEPIEKFSSSHQVVENPVMMMNHNRLHAQLQARDETEADLARQSGDPTLYKYYLGFIDPLNIFILVSCTAIYAFFITVPQYWLQLWTEAGDRDMKFYICGFFFLSFMSWASTSIQMWSVIIRIAPQSGLRIHQRLSRIVTGAPLSYFSQTDNGSTLNRFSQDVQIIDKDLPSAIQSVVTQVLKLLVQVMLLGMSEKWLLLPLPACGIVVYIIQKVYLCTSKQLRLLELESRSEVLSSFLESIEGLESIRSFGWSRAVIQKISSSVDNSQRPEFLLLCLQRWLNLVLDFLAAMIATSAVAVAVYFRGQTSGAEVGIALNIMLVANTTLLKLVENWTNLETSFGAIARLKTLESMTPIEGDGSCSLDPPKSWPSAGRIEFKNITASYRSDSAAISDLSLSVNAGQRLIVYGRTGSGKSTLILTLLRLLELQSGTIRLDGVDIKQVRLELLRERCFIAVSQDPLILLNESLRFNLDTRGSVSDDVLVVSLEKAGLWSHFSESDTHIGEATAPVLNIAGFGDQRILDQKVSVFRELSVGQCQLFALCRALIKANILQRSGLMPVVVLDEVTSSLDNETESTIYRIIDNEFTRRGHTVIIVAHRLGVLEKYTKRGRDIVALMAGGRLQEVFENWDSDDLHDRFEQKY